MENIWKEIVKERLRRKCESSLTKYSKKFFENIKFDTNSTSTNFCLEMPLIHEYKSPNMLLPYNIEDCNTPVVNKSLNYAPLTMVLIENQNCKSTYNFLSENIKENKTAKVEQKVKWPGMLEVMESYKRYSKGTKFF